MNRPGERFHNDGTAPARFSAVEFLRMADLGAFDDMKVELDHGELVRMNPPYTEHAAAQGRVLTALAAALASREVLVVGEIAVMLGSDTVRAFDTAVIDRAALDERILQPRHVRLGVEISESSLDRDLGEKLRDYAAAGIAHYWVVDVKARVVHVMAAPNDEAYDERTVVRFGEPLSLPGGGTVTLD